MINWEFATKSSVLCDKDDVVQHHEARFPEQTEKIDTDREWRSRSDITFV
jgi:hypothetical protein